MGQLDRKGRRKNHFLECQVKGLDSHLLVVESHRRFLSMVERWSISNFVPGPVFLFIPTIPKPLCSFHRFLRRYCLHSRPHCWVPNTCTHFPADHNLFIETSLHHFLLISSPLQRWVGPCGSTPSVCSNYLFSVGSHFWVLAIKSSIYLFILKEQ